MACKTYLQIRKVFAKCKLRQVKDLNIKNHEELTLVAPAERFAET